MGFSAWIVLNTLTQSNETTLICNFRYHSVYLIVFNFNSFIVQLEFRVRVSKSSLLN